LGSFFKDEKFQDMDFLTQAVRPFLWEPYDSYIQLPEEIGVPYEMFKSKTYGLRLSSILTSVSEEFFGKREALYPVIEWFDVKVEDGTYIDLNERKIVGKVTLIKTKDPSEEEVIQQLVSAVNWLNHSKPKVNGLASRSKEILELLGQPIESRNTFYTLQKTVRAALLENKLKIFNGDLMTKMSKWIYDYVVDGDIQALANFSKLKVMTHKGEPIYSMKEIV
jgi:hypothetical protein